jgi:cytochrome c oxidase assembly factor CtaG
MTAAAFAPPVTGWTEQTLALHMTVQMLLLAVVTPLIAYGGGPRFGHHAPWTLYPAVGIAAVNVAVIGAQIPALVDAGMRNLLIHDLVQAAFVLGALTFWCPIVGTNRLSGIAKLGALMVASVPSTIPGITMALSHHQFYAAYRSIEDQQIAGLLLFATAKFALVGGAFVVLWRLLTPDVEPDDRDDREAPVDDLPPTAPAWLRRLDERLPDETIRIPARRPAKDRELIPV